MFRNKYQFIEVAKMRSAFNQPRQPYPGYLHPIPTPRERFARKLLNLAIHTAKGVTIAVMLFFVVGMVVGTFL